MILSQRSKQSCPMADVHTPAQRSRNMSAIRSRDTEPELIVRRLIHSLGLRHSLHNEQLPGRPDCLLTRHRIALFVHGCFWHMHSCRFGRVSPVTNRKFWSIKREENRERDKRVRRKLQALGWKSVVIWECETKQPEKLEQAILTRVLTITG